MITTNITFDYTNRRFLATEASGTYAIPSYNNISYGVATTGTGSTATTVTVTATNVTSTSTIIITPSASKTLYYNNIVDGASFDIVGVSTGATSTSWIVIN